VQVDISVRHGHGTLSPSVSDHIRTKSEKLLTFFDRVTAIKVIVDFSNDRANVEILVDAEHRHDLVSHESGAVGEAVTPVFDAALHKMEQQLRKYKEKIQDHRRDPALGEIAEAAEKRNPEGNP
jgi:putative sigma-54 modulation protein